MTIYMGVDWETKNIRCQWTQDLKKTKPIKGCKPLLHEVDDLIQRLLERAKAKKDEQVHVIIEAGSVYWVNLFHQVGVIVHVIDPKKARRFAQTLCSSGAKDDRRDARVLLEMGRSIAHCPPPFSPKDEPEQKINTLQKALQRQLETKKRMAQQLRSVLRQRMPMVEATIKSIDSDWAIKVLSRAPTLYHLKKLSDKQRKKLLESSKIHDKTEKKFWKAVDTEQAPWINKELANIEGIEVKGTLGTIKALKKSIKNLDKELEKALEQHDIASRILEIPGMGKKLTSAVIVSGALDDPENRNGLAIKMGAAPVFCGSGTNKHGKAKGHVKMRRSCSSFLRRSSFLSGRLCSQNTKWGKAMLEDGLQQGQSYGTIYRRIARSLFRIIQALVRTGEHYDEDRYIRALQKKGVKWAQNIECLVA